jgi:hypothetical protein
MNLTGSSNGETRAIEPLYRRPAVACVMSKVGGKGVVATRAGRGLLGCFVPSLRR